MVLLVPVGHIRGPPPSPVQEITDLDETLHRIVCESEPMLSSSLPNIIDRDLSNVRQDHCSQPLGNQYFTW